MISYRQKACILCFAAGKYGAAKQTPEKKNDSIPIERPEPRESQEVMDIANVFYFFWNVHNLFFGWW